MKILKFNQGKSAKKNRNNAAFQILFVKIVFNDSLPIF